MKKMIMIGLIFMLFSINVIADDTFRFSGLVGDYIPPEVISNGGSPGGGGPGGSSDKKDSSSGKDIVEYDEIVNVIIPDSEVVEEVIVVDKVEEKKKEVVKESNVNSVLILGLVFLMISIIVLAIGVAYVKKK